MDDVDYYGVALKKDQHLQQVGKGRQQEMASRRVVVLSRCLVPWWKKALQRRCTNTREAGQGV
jgi:hypothetical protein